MNPENENQHIISQIPDYVLDLLPSTERQMVTLHIAHCWRCRQAVIGQREIGAVVKKTITRAAAVEESHLAGLMPDIPRQKGIRAIINQSQRQIIVASCLLILAVASVGMQLRLQNSSWLATSPALISTSVMMTKTPTATLQVTSDNNLETGTLYPTPAKGHSGSMPEAALAPAASSPSLPLPAS